MILCAPFCAKDAALCRRSLEWMHKMHGQANFDCVISHDSRDDALAPEIVALAKRSFRKAHVHRYEPWGGNAAWPFPQNWAFQNAARFMVQFGEPWLWLEADAIPLKPDWLEQLNGEYAKGGEPFMGAFVDDSPHGRYMAGVAVYPPNVSSYSVNAMLCRSGPWDVVGAKDFLPRAHRANHLIHHIRSEHPATFISREDVTRHVPANAVVFHKCKDGSLIDWLEVPKATVRVMRTIDNAKRTIRGLLHHHRTYYHSGNLGDIIYALYAIKEFGGGDLYLGPEQIRTARCSAALNQAQFDFFKPLLDCQDYIVRLSYTARHPGDKAAYDLNRFRNYWLDCGVRERECVQTLCQMHFYALGILHRFHFDTPWLRVPEPIATGRVVIHRSARYHGNFPWKRLVERHGKRLLFVGLPDEHAAFEKEFGRVTYWKPRDALETAQLIAGGGRILRQPIFPAISRHRHGTTGVRGGMGQCGLPIQPPELHNEVRGIGEMAMKRRSFIKGMLLAALAPAALIASAPDRHHWKQTHQGVWVPNPAWVNAPYEVAYINFNGEPMPVTAEMYIDDFKDKWIKQPFPMRFNTPEYHPENAIPPFIRV